MPIKIIKTTIEIIGRKLIIIGKIRVDHSDTFFQNGICNKLWPGCSWTLGRFLRWQTPEGTKGNNFGS
jgi:hypothetical protein